MWCPLSCHSDACALLFHNEGSYTPLIIVCIGGHTDTARVLLDHGAVVDYPSKYFGKKIPHCTIIIYCILDLSHHTNFLSIC